MSNATNHNAKANCHYTILFPCGNPVCDLQRGKAPAPGGKVTNQCVMSSFVPAAHVASGQAGCNGRLRTEREHCECLGKAAAVACPVSESNYTAR